MAEIDFDRYNWACLKIGTPKNSVALALKPGVRLEGGAVFGVLHAPPVTLKEVRSDSQLARALSRHVGAVVVVGHGSLDMPEETFTWTGSVQEFNETWKGD